MSRVTVSFGPDGAFEYRTDAADGMARSEADEWIDRAFIEFACEPLRPSGKVLAADKLLAVAEAAGPLWFGRETAWAQRYADTATLLLGRPEIRVDTEQHSMGY